MFNIFMSIMLIIFIGGVDILLNGSVAIKASGYNVNMGVGRYFVGSVCIGISAILSYFLYRTLKNKSND